jgi:hypothetical protein
MAPVLQGKLDKWRSFTDQMNGPRRAEHDASRKRMGMTREVASLMQTPHGDFVCLCHEADSLKTAFQMLAESQEPYDVWSRENAVDIHGITPEMMSKTPAVVVFDWPGH